MKIILITLLILLTAAVGIPQEDNVTAFVTRFYEIVLNRNPDPTGLNNWTNGLLNKTHSGEDIARGFINSTEFIKRNTTNEQFLQILYKAFFNRQPDQGGYNNWLEALKIQTRNEVLDGFLYSTEFKNLCDSYGIVANSISAFVTRFYKLALGRDPDQVGLSNWVESLRSKEKSGSDVAMGFIFSKEFIGYDVSNKEYLQILYESFFNRQPDKGGYDNWLKKLEDGHDRKVILYGFIYSNEFKILCEKYNILAYSNPPQNYIGKYDVEWISSIDVSHKGFYCTNGTGTLEVNDSWELVGSITMHSNTLGGYQENMEILGVVWAGGEIVFNEENQNRPQFKIDAHGNPHIDENWFDYDNSGCEGKWIVTLHPS